MKLKTTEICGFWFIEGEVSPGKTIEIARCRREYAREIVARWNQHEGLVEALDRIHHIRSEPPESDSETMLRVCIHIAAKALAEGGKENA